MGIGLDYSETFRNHPCPTRNTTEKNYTLCFVAYSLFMLAAMLVGKSISCNFNKNWEKIFKTIFTSKKSQNYSFFILSVLFKCNLNRIRNLKEICKGWLFKSNKILLATQFRFGNEQRPDEAACTVIETRIDEIAPAVAEKARVRQLQVWLKSTLIRRN